MNLSIWNDAMEKAADDAVDEYDGVDVLKEVLFENLHHKQNIDLLLQSISRKFLAKFGEEGYKRIFIMAKRRATKDADDCAGWEPLAF